MKLFSKILVCFWSGVKAFIQNDSLKIIVRFWISGSVWKCIIFRTFCMIAFEIIV